MQALSSKPQQANIEGNQETAISLLKSVPRPGIESLLDYLLAYDYFTALASTVFRESYPGGPCLHSLNLVSAFDAANEKLNHPAPNDSVVICGLLHDLCKVGAYIPIDRGYTSVKSCKGHATLSISRIKEHIQLTPQEDDIIRYHMGLFGIFTYHEHDTLALFKAISRNPHVQIFAALDMADSKRKTGTSDSLWKVECRGREL